MTHYRLWTIAAFVVLAACSSGPAKKDYELAARCQQSGYQPGTADYDRCIDEERSRRLMQQQRDEFQRMKQDERDWKLRPY